MLKCSYDQNALVVKTLGTVKRCNEQIPQNPTMIKRCALCLQVLPSDYKTAQTYQLALKCSNEHTSNAQTL